MKKSLNLQVFALVIILALGLLLRLYRINEPLADWHSWRQADTSAVTRRYIQEGIDLIHPKYDDLSSIPSGLENPQGYRFVEFPFINGLTAIFARSFQSLSVVVWGRLVSIVFSLGSIVLLYRITKKEFDVKTGLMAALIFAVLPYNIFYHRTILPEIPLLFFTLLAFDTFLTWLNSKQWRYYFLSLCSAQLALLLKPYFIIFTLPMIYVSLKHFGFSALKKKSLYVYVFAMVIPLLLWRLWILQFPEGIPAYTWLLNGTNIRFRPAFFRWIFAERIAKLITGYWGLIPFGVGLAFSNKKSKSVMLIWWIIASLFYLTIFATGNVTHDYYQIIIIPPITILMAKGLTTLLFESSTPAFNSKTSKLIGIVSLIFSISFSWYHIRDYFNINHPEIVKAGEIANLILPKDAKVIAPYGGDTAFLYQINRRGWPIGGGIEDKIKKGATDYVTVSLDEEANWLSDHCRPTVQVEDITIINLRNCSL